MIKDGYMRLDFEETTAPHQTQHHIIIRIFYRKSLSPGTYKIETSHSVPLGQSLIIAQYSGGGYTTYHSTNGSLNISYAKNSEYKGRFKFSATGLILKTVNDRPVHNEVQVTVSGVFDTKSSREF